MFSPKWGKPDSLTKSRKFHCEIFILTEIVKLILEIISSMIFFTKKSLTSSVATLSDEKPCRERDARHGISKVHDNLSPRVYEF